MWEVRTTLAFDAWFAELEEDGQVEIIAKADELFDAHLARLKAQRKKKSEGEKDG
jgi:hypothetical protein